MISTYRALTGRLGRFSDVPLLLLRAFIAWMFVLHALQKYNMPVSAFERYMLVPAGVPLPGVLAPVVPVVELAGAALIAAGLFTRVAALMLGIEMCFTGFLIKLSVLHTGILGPNGVGGAELDMLYLSVFIVLLFVGPGALSLDARFGLEAPRFAGTLAWAAPAPGTTGAAAQPAAGGTQSEAGAAPQEAPAGQQP